MIKITDKTKCCGCTACVNVCPTKAITMHSDQLGFLYPIVEESMCIDCGRCIKVCAFHNEYDRSLNLPYPVAYAVRHKDSNEVATSRSGAAFIAIADWALSHDGVVYGAGYADHFRVIHKRAESKQECFEFKGSKYVQSDLNTVFTQVKKDLASGKIVLFSGTPCQTAALNSFVGAKYRSNLYLVDIVCHGVPSPFIWRDYLQYIENKYGKRVISLSFRDKSELGWAAHRESFTFDDKKIYRNTYTYLFYEHIMFRPSCSKCPYTNMTRPSDLTCADFWGWEKTDVTINADDRGISLLLCNTDKGVKLFDTITGVLNVKEVALSNCVQPNLLHPSIPNKNAAKFERDYSSRGFLYVARRYGDLGWRYFVQRFIQKCRTVIRILFKK